MSHKITEKCNNQFHQQHFLLLSNQPHYNKPPLKCYYQQRITAKSKGTRGGGGVKVLCSSFYLLLYSLILQLLYATASAAQHIPNNHPAAATVLVETSSTPDATNAEVAATAKTFIDNKSKVFKRSQHSTFSDLDKEVGMNGIPSLSSFQFFFFILTIICVQKNRSPLCQ